MEGSEIKLRLLSERTASTDAVHVDWLSFTVYLRHAPIPDVEVLFPLPQRIDTDYFDDATPYMKERAFYGRFRVANQLKQLPDPDFAASAQAYEIATAVAMRLGPDFKVEPDMGKGRNFYRFRWSITRGGVKEVAWVGFLASGESPRQMAQSNTIHVCIEGAGCTFAQPGWRRLMADYIDSHRGLITRCDLALDFFDGLQGGMERFRADYKDGLMDHMGNHPKHNCVGPWEGGIGRSFYLGTKATGKQTNFYEKGIQLFGEESASPWIRAEVRYSNAKRLLPTEMLRRPDDFFSGSSDYHSALLREHGATAVPEKTKLTKQLQDNTVEGAVQRIIRWFMNTAAPAAWVLFDHLDAHQMDLVLDCKKGQLPGRLQRFKREEVFAVDSAHKVSQIPI
ncbi:replication initiation factor domain-containing protein [Comamonas odontotermitis]|uniref:replication initiation factor domain-containing protein n=1 Tax=Comamonas odontotermitis TaxID=379895 RepID=UPI003671CE9A